LAKIVRILDGVARFAKGGVGITEQPNTIGSKVGVKNSNNFFGIQALQAGRPPRVVLRATHEGALAYCSLADLKRFAIDLA